jgi:hypothetical protein
MIRNGKLTAENSALYHLIVLHMMGPSLSLCKYLYICTFPMDVETHACMHLWMFLSPRLSHLIYPQTVTTILKPSVASETGSYLFHQLIRISVL